MAKKVTPEQTVAQRRAMLIAKFNKVCERSVANNIGNKLTDEVATGIYTVVVGAAAELLKELEDGVSN